MKPEAPTYFELTRKLTAYHRKQTRFGVISGLLNFIAALLPLLLMLAVVEKFFHFSSIGRLFCLIFFAITALALAFRFLFHAAVALFKPIHSCLIDTAIEVGAHYKGVNDRLGNALQVYENYERDKYRYSVALIEASLTQVADELKQEDFSRHVDLQPFNKSYGRALLVTGIFILMMFSFHQPLSAALLRLFQPGRDFSHGQIIQFVVKPGDITLVKGEPLTLSAWLSDSTIHAASLSLRSEFKTEVIPLTKTTDDSFRHQVEAVRDTLTYFFTADHQNSTIYKILPVERPFLRSLKVQVRPPTYAKLPPYFLEDNIGDVSALKGSRIDLKGVANKELAAGILLFADSSSLPLSIDRRTISASFTLIKDDQYSFSLVDHEGNHSQSSIVYHLNVVPDAHPLVQIVLPGKDIDLGDDMTIPLLIEAQDDYGISRMRLAYQVVSGSEGEMDSTRLSFREIQGFEKNQELVRLVMQWNLSELDMFPTDVMIYFVEVYDNDSVSGPKRGRSQVFRARFPSMFEMYQEVAQDQDSATDSLQEALDRSRELQQKAAQLTLEMEREQKLDWQKKNELENVIQKQEEINQQLDDISKKMDEMIEKIEKNDLFSQETLKKFEEIRQLYQDIMTPELKETLEKMSEALQNLDEEAIKQAMEELKQNMDDYNKALDRTISLLKKLKVEQKLDQAQKMAQDLAERQQKISEQSQQKDADSSRLQKEQEQINKDAEALADLMKEVQEDLKSLPMPPLDPLESAMQQMQEDNLAQNLEQIQNMMQQNQMATVPQKSSQAQSTFEKMAEQLQTANQMMSGEMQRRAMQAMRKSSRDVLSLSQQQEDLMQQTQELARNSPQFPEAAERQQEISSGLRRVVDEMSQTMKDAFGMSTKVSKSLGQAMTQMDQALEQMEARENQQAAGNQAGAMSAMNSAVREMQNSMQSMMQQGGAGGMSYQQFMQQMQQLGDSQSQINQQTQGMTPGPGLTPGQQAAMARLAAEQRQVRKSMETLAREAGGMSEILGSMDKIVDDMKKVEQDLGSQQITRDTINRQNRILSRMLDAQKSVNKREFSRERQAETGKQYLVNSPDDLPADRGERMNQLQKELLRAKKEGFTRDYLQIIENYFKALTEHESANQ
jgi:hypothetical protein